MTHNKFGLGLLAIVLCAFLAACPDGNGTGTDPDQAADVDWSNYTTSYAFRVRNLTSENLVVFKNSVSTSNCIGGLPAGPDYVQGFKNDSAKFGTNTGDFVLIFIKNEDYEAKKSSPSLLAALGQQPFGRIWGYHNGNGENDQIFEVSGYLGGAGTIEIQNGTGLNLELRLDSPTGESIGFAKGDQTGGIKLHLEAPKSYQIYPVFKSYDGTHNRVITIKPTFPDNHENTLLRGQPYREVFTLNTTETVIIDAQTFYDKLSQFTTGSAYLLVENVSGIGVQIQKGSILLNDEMDTSILNNQDHRTFTIDMAKLATNLYAETADVGQFRIGPPGATRTLYDNLVQSNGTTAQDNSVLTLDVDYMYQITVLPSGKFRWDGVQGNRVSLTDLQEEEE
jgi:hypothetical protein